MNEFEILEEKCNALVEELRLLKIKQAENNERNNKRWRADEEENYWCVNESGNTVKYTESGHTIDDFNYVKGNYFKSKEETEQHLKNLKTKQKLKDLALKLNNGREIDWTNAHQNKYFIRYDYTFNELIQGYNMQQACPGNVYCLDADFLKCALTVIYQDDLINLIKSGV